MQLLNKSKSITLNTKEPALVFDEFSATAKAIGAVAGVLLSMFIIAPKGGLNTIVRGLGGFIGGIIFTPAAQALIPFFGDQTFEEHLQAACATAFCCWFILEAIARFLSREDTLLRLFEELIHLRGDRNYRKKDDETH
jgi:hypothetical protein